MFIIDAHCDTITKLMDEGGELKCNQYHNDLDRLKVYGGFVQFFAAFIEPIYSPAYAMRRAIQIIDRLYQEIEINKDVMSLCCNYNDIQATIQSGKIGAFLSIEGGEALQGNLSSLRMFYKLGVRSICLTWNHRNEIADGVADAASGGGLTPFGRDVIKEMNRLGMLVDVSHISEKGFWDVVDLSNSPVIASHSNAKAICDHRRNLSDSQIEALKKSNGVIGINLCTDFLSSNGTPSLKDIIMHIEHIAEVGGTSILGLGADFDGIDATPAGIQGVQDIYLIFDELLRLNYSDEDVEKMAGGNFQRVIKEVCQK